MRYEIVDIGFENVDDVGFNGYENMVVGYGEDFCDAANDAAKLFSDLTNRNPLVIMLAITKQFSEKMGMFGPANTNDSKHNKSVYALGVRFNLC